MNARRFRRYDWMNLPTIRPTEEALGKAGEMIDQYETKVEFLRGEPMIITADKTMHFPLAFRMSEKISRNSLLSDRSAVIIEFKGLVRIMCGEDYNERETLSRCHVLVTGFSANVPGYSQEQVLDTMRVMKSFRERSIDKGMDCMNRHIYFTERDFRHDMFLPYLYNDEATPLEGPAMTGLPYPFVNYMHFGHMVGDKFELYYPPTPPRGRKLRDN